MNEEKPLDCRGIPENGISGKSDYRLNDMLDKITPENLHEAITISDGYTVDQQRVAEYLNELGIGGGGDPVGFLMASHSLLIEQRRWADTLSLNLRRCLAGDDVDLDRALRKYEEVRGK